MTCLFSVPGHQVACLSLMKQREAGMTRPYSENECYSCPMRRKRLEGEKPPQRINIPKGDFGGKGTPPPKLVGAGRVMWDAEEARFKEAKAEIIPRIIPGTIPPKEETGVNDDKARERVLSRILREKVCSKSRLMNFSGVSKVELDEITAALVAEGKIKAWSTGGRGVRYTPPDAEDPTGGSGSALEKAGKPETPKARKSATPRVAPATPVVAGPSYGSSSILAAIAELEAKKTSIDQALEALRRTIA